MTNREKAIKAALKAGYKAFSGGNGYYATKTNKDGKKNIQRGFSGYKTEEDALVAVGATLVLDFE